MPKKLILGAKAVKKGKGKVAIVNEKGRQVLTLSPEESIKLAHALLDLGEKALP